MSDGRKDEAFFRAWGWRLLMSDVNEGRDGVGEISKMPIS